MGTKIGKVSESGLFTARVGALSHAGTAALTAAQAGQAGAQGL
jgi:hypothetical protein